MRIKCLSLSQPYASLIALHAKTIETRSWSTEYRGPLGIHAAKGFPRECQMLSWTDPFYSALRQGGYLAENVMVRPQKPLPLGCIVAVCELVDVLRIPDEPCRNFERDMVTDRILKHLYGDTDRKDWQRAARMSQELAFGDYTPGRYMWLLSNVRPLPQPIPMRGQRRLFEVEIDEEAMEGAS